MAAAQQLQRTQENQIYIRLTNESPYCADPRAHFPNTVLSDLEQSEI